MSHPFSLSGRTALGTGATSGLGYEMALALAQAGARVLVNGRTPERADAAARRICEQAGADGAQGLSFDVADFSAAETALDGAGPIDILVNNAGARDRRAFFDLDTAALTRLLEAMVLGPALLCRRLGRDMVERGHGRIINVTSIAGPLARAGDAGYTTAKGGLEALTRALAAEFGPHGVTVNAIAPGYFATAPNAAMAGDPQVGDWLARRTALGRWGRPEEIAGAAVFLASDAASYVTGHVLAVDGGYLAHF